MLIYPWLLEKHQCLLNQYRSSRVHHTLLLIAASPEMSQAIIDSVVQTLLCQHSKFKHEPCQICSDCLLFQAKAHPDYYQLTPLENNKKIGVESIRELTQSVLQTPQRSKYHFVIIPEINQLTEAASNALLKLIEEPPPQSYFILTTNRLLTIPATIRSRCLIINLPHPTPAVAKQWLQQQLSQSQLITPEEIETALLLSDGAPEIALKLLHSAQWSLREHFFELVRHALQHHTFIRLLDIRIIPEAKLITYWLATLFGDIKKSRVNLLNYMINCDQHELIFQFGALTLSERSLCDLELHCLKIYKQMAQVQGINHELLLIELFIQIDSILFT